MDLQPGLGVGPFRLGMTLWDCMNHLRSSSTPASINWDGESPNESHILVTASPTSSIRLLFSGRTQRLITCEVTPPSIQTVTWRGQPLVPSTSPNVPVNPQRLLHSRFGPTYPPTPHPSFQDELVLSYPGVCFGYAKDDKAQMKGTVGEGGDKAVYSPLSRLLVTTHNPEHGQVQGLPDISELEKDDTLSTIADGDISHVSITLGDGLNATSMLLNIISSDVQSAQIQLGVTTSEDLICDLGNPLRTYWKEDDRLSIHSAATASASAKSVTPNAYFFNYFSLGLDFLLDPDSHTVIKVLIHGNTPGEVLFGRYARCRWSMGRSDGDGAEEVTSEDDLDKVKAFLSGSLATFNAPTTNGKVRPAVNAAAGDHAHRTERAMVLDRTADSKDGIKLERPTELLAYPGVVLEVTQNRAVETIWLV